MVIRPFGRWTTDHLNRVNHSHDELQSQVKSYDKQVEHCKKLRQTYYNKCRVLEDLEEETNLAFPTTPAPPTAEEKGKTKEKAKEPATVAAPVKDTSAAAAAEEETPKSPVTRKSSIEDDDWPLEIGDGLYSKEQLSELLATMIKEIPQKEVKVLLPFDLVVERQLTKWTGPHPRNLQKLRKRLLDCRVDHCNPRTHDLRLRRENRPGSRR
jgi:hypothetical protein